jgi:peroxiredoxin family protein
MSGVDLRDVPSGERSTDANVHATEARLRELESQVAELAQAQIRSRQGITIIAFSGEMDKLMTAFMLATGAAAMGMTVSMFFTFWALAAVRKGSKFQGKGFLDRLLTAMLPSGPDRLGPSRWNMLGLGRPFLKHVLRTRHVETLGNLVLLARAMGVRMVACQTSMEVMGLTREEMLEGVELGGVATCLDVAQSSGPTLLI